MENYYKPKGLIKIKDQNNNVLLETENMILKTGRSEIMKNGIENFTDIFLYDNTNIAIESDNFSNLGIGSKFKIQTNSSDEYPIYLGTSSSHTTIIGYLFSGKFIENFILGNKTDESGTDIYTTDITDFYFDNTSKIYFTNASNYFYLGTEADKFSDTGTGSNAGREILNISNISNSIDQALNQQAFARKVDNENLTLTGITYYKNIDINNQTISSVSFGNDSGSSSEIFTRATFAPFTLEPGFSYEIEYTLYF